MNNIKHEKDLRILKSFCNQTKVTGGFANQWFTSLRNGFPWHYLYFSKSSLNEKALECHKTQILYQYKMRIEKILEAPLEQDEVDELVSINEILDRICYKRDNIESKYDSYEDWQSGAKQRAEFYKKMGFKMNFDNAGDTTIYPG